MKKTVQALMALLLFAASVAFAGLQPVATRLDYGYVVQPGDTLWQLADVKLSNPWAWKEIIGQNPMLSQKGRVFVKDGKTIVIVHPGEKLYGLEKWVPYAATLPMPVTEPSSITHTLLRNEPVQAQSSGIPWWLMLLAGLVLFAVLAKLWLDHVLSRDAATSGPAIVPGGVNNAEAARERMQQMAAQQHQRATGRQVPVQYFDVLRQQRGRISGVMNVRYADGSEAPRRLSDAVGYQAEVRFPDGRTEVLYMLAACGNDLRYGGVNRYLPGPQFSFVPDAVEGTAATREQPATAATEPQHTEPVPLREGVAFEYKPAANGRPAMARFRGNHQVDVHEDGTVTLRLA